MKLNRDLFSKDVEGMRKQIKDVGYTELSIAVEQFRQDPAYMDGNHPLHKQVVNAVGTIVEEMTSREEAVQHGKDTAEDAEHSEKLRNPESMSDIELQKMDDFYKPLLKKSGPEILDSFPADVRVFCEKRYELSNQK